MVPALYMRLESLPRLPNGKLDRLALPAPDMSGLAVAEYAAPRSNTEQDLAGIWSELLGLSIGSFGIDDDFFALGGHSLLAVRLIARIRQVFHVELPFHTVFEGPTLRGLSAQVEQASLDGTSMVTRRFSHGNGRSTCRCHLHNSVCGSFINTCPARRPPITCRWRSACAGRWM